jgi:hypothetical protein
MNIQNVIPNSIIGPYFTVLWIWLHLVSLNICYMIHMEGVGTAYILIGKPEVY